MPVYVVTVWSPGETISLSSEMVVGVFSTWDLATAFIAKQDDADAYEINHWTLDEEV